MALPLTPFEQESRRRGAPYEVSLKRSAAEKERRMALRQEREELATMPADMRAMLTGTLKKL